MSLINFAARISAVEATKGNTIVGSNVLDSEIGVLDIAADGSLKSRFGRLFLVTSVAGRVWCGYTCPQ
ncbi:MAG: 4Fe-4S binding protein, partial [Rhizobium pusense]|nr:4Fe-4S binding protein [Agrobacterium pusense]